MKDLPIDDCLWGGSVRDLLATAGVEVVTALNGAEAPKPPGRARFTLTLPLLQEETEPSHA